MELTYADATPGTIWDGELVTEVEHFQGGEHHFVRVAVASGGRRTEAADHPAEIQHWADPKLVNASDRDLDRGMEIFADMIEDNLPDKAKVLDMLHALALERNRRRALACLARKCVCHGRGR